MHNWASCQQVGEDGDTVQEAREAVDEFPSNMQNGKKYSSEDVAEKRKRLRWAEFRLARFVCIWNIKHSRITNNAMCVCCVSVCVCNNINEVRQIFYEYTERRADKYYRQTHCLVDDGVWVCWVYARVGCLATRQTGLEPISTQTPFLSRVFGTRSIPLKWAFFFTWNWKWTIGEWWYIYICSKQRYCEIIMFSISMIYCFCRWSADCMQSCMLLLEIVTR